MAAETARLVGCPAEQVLVASTGVIGVALDIEKIRRGLPDAMAALGGDQGANGRAGDHDDRSVSEGSGGAADDRRPRHHDRRHGQGLRDDRADDGDDARVLTTDAAVPRPLLERALREVVDDTFNAITVDGECSTNDCVMLLANGASGVDDRRRELRRLRRTRSAPSACGWRSASCAAAKARPSSITVTVTGAASPAEARRAAKAIANSPLVKTAIHGGDPNWGRLIAVAGRAGVAFELSTRGGEDRARSCCSRTVGRTTRRRRKRPRTCSTTTSLISVDLGAGSASSTVWTCDLSAEYVRINAEYRT